MNEAIKFIRAQKKLWDMVDKDPDGCWMITTNFSGKYAQIVVRGYRMYAHRFAYELVVGPIPDDMDLDHECHNRAAERGECDGGKRCPHHKCVRPDHLIPKPRRDNLVDSPLTQAAINSSKIRCKRKHEFTPENTRIGDAGWRSCRACGRMTKAEREEWDRNNAIY